MCFKVLGYPTLQISKITLHNQPIRPSNLYWINRQSNSLTIFNIFSAKWAPNSMLTMNKQLWTLYDFRIHWIGRRIGTEWMVRAIRWQFSKNFQPNEHRMRCWLHTNCFEHCMISGFAKSSIESVPFCLGLWTGYRCF